MTAASHFSLSFVSSCTCLFRLCWVFIAARLSLWLGWALLAAVALVAAQHTLQGARASAAVGQQLDSCGSRAENTGSVLVVRRLSCSAAGGIFPDHGRNPPPAGACFTTEPPGKLPLHAVKKQSSSLHLSTPQHLFLHPRD